MSTATMDGQMVMTSDPVSVVEIADRCGVDLHVAQHWRRSGKLGDPHWTIGPTVAWAWELVSDTEIIRQHLGTFDWSGVADALPRMRVLTVVIAGPGQTYNVQRRIDRNLNDRGERCGWVSVPLDGGRRLFVTDYEGFTSEQVVPREADNRSYQAIVGDAIAGVAELHRTGDRRIPAVSPTWQ